MRILRSGFVSVVVLGHALVIVLSIMLASLIWLGSGASAHWASVVTSPSMLLAGYTLISLIIFSFSGLYRFDARWSVAAEVRDSLKAVTLLAILTFSAIYILKLGQASRVVLMLFFVFLWAGITLTTVGVRAFFRHWRRAGHIKRNVLIVGTSPAILPVIDTLVRNHPELGVHIQGYLGRADGLIDRIPYLGTTDRLGDVLTEFVIDEVVVAPRETDLENLDAIVQIAQEQGKTIRIPMPAMGYSIQQGKIESVDGTPLLTVGPTPSRTVAFAAKRITDVAGSAVALVILSPLMLAVAVTIWITDGRPILYGDHRAGIHGRPIKIHKFRTMIVGANDLRSELAERNQRIGPDFKLDDDPRITPVGRFLRRTSLDELPQFWDILVGNLSLVGPRAQRLDEVAGYDAWHRRRLSVKPGLTGLWQVTARQDPSFDVRASLDLEYIDNWSHGLDLRILLNTVPAVFRSTGA